jgi:hypothetical protein
MGYLRLCTVDRRRRQRPSMRARIIGQFRYDRSGMVCFVFDLAW